MKSAKKNSVESKNDDVGSVELERERLKQEYLDAKEVQDQAKKKYNLFCIENPAKLKSNPSVHELRMMRKKVGEVSNNEHSKLNRILGEKNKLNAAIENAKG